MFRASSAHLQEDAVVHMQHMVLSLSIRVPGDQQVIRNSHREWDYHMLHVYDCILLKMSTWGSKHVEENSILWINNNQCIKVGNYYMLKLCYHIQTQLTYMYTNICTSLPFLSVHILISFSYMLSFGQVPSWRFKSSGMWHWVPGNYTPNAHSQAIQLVSSIIPMQKPKIPQFLLV